MIEPARGSNSKPDQFARKNNHSVIPVFDRATDSNSPLKTRSVFNPCVQTTNIHRTARDNIKPRGTVTAYLMGDPKPGRSAFDRMDAPVADNDDHDLEAAE